MYNQKLYNRYTSCPYRGIVDKATFVSSLKNAACGDSVTWYCLVNAHGSITTLRYQGSGCIISQGAASLLAEALEGTSVADCARYTAQDLLSLIALPLGPVRAQCALLALDALQAGLKNVELCKNC